MNRAKSKHILVIGLLCIGLSVLLGFLVSADIESIKGFDRYINSASTLSISSPWLSVVLFFSGIGDLYSIVLLSLGGVFALLYLRKKQEVYIWLLGIGATGILSEALKYFFLTTRPLQNLTDTLGPAYPSGHTSAIWFLAILSILIFVLRTKKTALRLISFIIIFSLAGAVSLSRILLEAHWVSDVIGGILLGTGTSLAIFGLGQLYRQRS